MGGNNILLLFFYDITYNGEKSNVKREETDKTRPCIVIEITVIEPEPHDLPCIEGD